MTDLGKVTFLNFKKFFLRLQQRQWILLLNNAWEGNSIPVQCSDTNSDQKSEIGHKEDKSIISLQALEWVMSLY